MGDVITLTYEQMKTLKVIRDQRSYKFEVEVEDE